MGKILVSGRKPCPQTNEKYEPNHKQHLKSQRDLLTHLLYCRASCEDLEKFFGGFSHSFLGALVSPHVFSFVSNFDTEIMKVLGLVNSRSVALYEDAHQRPEVSRALSISGTSASRSNCLSVWRVELNASLPHKKHSWESFKYQKEVKYPTQNLPVRTGARLFNYFKL